MESQTNKTPLPKFYIDWVQEDGFVYGDAGTTASAKILALDMDDTLIRVKGKTAFAKDEHDWLLLNDKVATTIQEYSLKGYKIVVVTNQAGVEKGTTNLSVIQKKIEMVIQAIGVPMQVFIATHKNYYRKPSPGLWKFMAEEMNDGVEIDKKASIFCGDAAGRPKRDTKHADFENTDYKFALNCGIAFKTPEMLYEGIHEELPEIEFHPKQIKASGSSSGDGEISIKKNNEKEMIIFVGPPPSGKTTFYKNYLAADYIHVNNEIYKTKAKCFKVAEEAMKEGKSVVIDNLNCRKDIRKEYLDLAKAHGYVVRAFVFNVDKDLCKHLNELRVYNKYREHHSTSVPKLIIAKFYKEYEEVSEEEGFDSIEKIEFVAGPFENKDDEEMFFSYLCTMK